MHPLILMLSLPSLAAEPILVPDTAVVQARYDQLTAPERADWLKRALERRKKLDPIFAPELAKRDLPPEIVAVALVESGFANIPQRGPQLPSGGVWQMIQPTARTYGLRVDDTIDERMSVERCTEAALDLLVDLRREFGDWGLAFAAYNLGSSPVHQAIETYGSRDVSALIEDGGVPTYAADVLAAVRLLSETE